MKLSPQLFSILTALVEERSGLHYELVDLSLIEDKLVNRAAESDFDSLLDYYYYLRYDPAGPRELDALVEALVVHETYFFREADQIRALIEVVIAPAIAAGRRPRIWCAACATGEEPYTLAMMLAERNLLQSTEIVASDISTRALDRARRGQFAGRSMRALPPGIMGRWLEQMSDHAVVSGQLKESIAWKRLNLIDRDAVVAQGPCDAILCRNVLIYFNDASALRVVEALGEALRPSGVLLVGVSESLLRFGTSLRCEERAGAFLYQKAG